MAQLPQTFVDENGVPAPIILTRDGAGKLVLPITVASGVNNGGIAEIQGLAASNAPAVGNPVLSGAKYNATPQTYDDGDVANNQADVNGYLKITPATALAGEDIPNDVTKVETRWNSGLAGGPVSASTLLKTGVGQFAGLVCTASSSGVIRVWDATSAAGTKILDSLSLTAGQTYSIPNGSYSFSVGCYLELVSGTCTVTPVLR